MTTTSPAQARQTEHDGRRSKRPHAAGFRQERLGKASPKRSAHTADVPSFDYHRSAFANETRSHCRLFSVNVETASNDQLIDLYLKDRFEIVIAQRQAVEELVVAILEAMLDVRLDSESPVPGLDDQAARHLFQRLSEHLPGLPTEPVKIDGKLCAEPDKQQLHSELVGFLSNDIDHLVDHTFVLFQKMADAGVLGTARFEEADPRVCTLSFARAVAIQHTDDQSERKEGGRRTTTRHGTLQYKDAQHCRLLMSAKRTPLCESTLTIPRRAQPIVEALGKSYLGKFVEVVDGDMKHERVVSRDVHHEPWTHTEVVEETLPEFFTHVDPALLLGNCILTAWCPAEQMRAAEEDERQTLHDTQRALAQTLFAGQVLVVVLAALFGILGSYSVVTRVFGNSVDFGAAWLVLLGMAHVPILVGVQALRRWVVRPLQDDKNLPTLRRMLAADFACAAALAAVFTIQAGMAAVWWWQPVWLIAIALGGYTIHWATNAYEMLCDSSDGRDHLCIAAVTAGLAILLAVPAWLYGYVLVAVAAPLLFLARTWKHAKRAYECFTHVN